MRDICVLSNSENERLYESLGFKVYISDDINKLKSVFDMLIKEENTAIIYLTNAVYEGIKEEVDEVENRLFPIVTQIPNGDTTKSRVDGIIKKAVGFDRV